jgi:hypothetical protein
MLVEVILQKKKKGKRKREKMKGKTIRNCVELWKEWEQELIAQLKKI